VSQFEEMKKKYELLKSEKELLKENNAKLDLKEKELTNIVMKNEQENNKKNNEIKMLINDKEALSKKNEVLNQANIQLTMNKETLLNKNQDLTKQNQALNQKVADGLTKDKLKEKEGKIAELSKNASDFAISNKRILLENVNLVNQIKQLQSELETYNEILFHRTFQIHTPTGVDTSKIHKQEILAPSVNPKKYPQAKVYNNNAVINNINQDYKSKQAKRETFVELELSKKKEEKSLENDKIPQLKVQKEDQNKKDSNKLPSETENKNLNVVKNPSNLNEIRDPRKQDNAANNTIIKDSKEVKNNPIASIEQQPSQNPILNDKEYIPIAFSKPRSISPTREQKISGAKIDQQGICIISNDQMKPVAPAKNSVNECRETQSKVIHPHKVEDIQFSPQKNNPLSKIEEIQKQVKKV